MPLYLNIPVNGEQLIRAFSWMLIHSLWQGLLLAVVTAVLMQVSRNATARIRYNILFTMMVLFMVACGFTFIHEINGAARTLVPLAGTLGQNATRLLQLNTSGLEQLTEAGAAWISAHAVWLVLVWTAFFAFRTFSITKGVLCLQKARREYVQSAAGWQQRLNTLSRQLQVRRPVRLLESAFVKAPMVIGHLKPVILIPAGLLTGLPAEQLEAVLLHELAHIRRCDYLVNLLQNMVEAVFFFNPGMLWVSALLRDEREHCCDTIAIEHTGNKRELIQALISFKEHALHAHHAAVAFPGRKNQLLHRVSRIIHNKNQAPGTREKLFFMAGALLLLLVVLTAGIAQLRHTNSVLAAVVPDLAGSYYVPSDKKESDAGVPALVARVQKPEPDRVVVKEAPALTHTEATAVVAKQAGIQPCIAAVQPEKSAPDVAPVQPEAHRKLLAEEAAYGQKQAQQDYIQAEKERQQFTLNDVQAEKDRQQADKDRIQAERDRAQAARDREQAAKDRIQAQKDREQARLDRIQADKDRLQADKDRAQAELDRQQAIKDREAAFHS